MDASNDNVVPLRKEEEPEERLIWICQCGCSTFELSNDGTAQCAFCHHTRHEEGGWFRKELQPEWDGDAPVANIQGNGSVEFAQRVVAKRAVSPDAVALVVVRSEGTIHTWSNLETDEQVSWACRRLEDAKALISKSNEVSS